MSKRKLRAPDVRRKKAQSFAQAVTESFSSSSSSGRSKDFDQPKTPLKEQGRSQSIDTLLLERVLHMTI
jgi:hypothetical protein